MVFASSDRFKMRPLKLGYDPWHAVGLNQELAKFFGAEVLERVNMNFSSLSNAMSVLESDLTLKRLNYGDNPVLKWCLSNTSIKLNNLGQMMPVKKFGSPKNRIDGAVALMVAYATLSRCRNDYLDLQKSIVG